MHHISREDCRSQGERTFRGAGDCLLVAVDGNNGEEWGKAQELGRRWDELTERTMRGYQAHPELKQAIADNYKQGRFEGLQGAPQLAEFAFIEKVKAARQAPGG